jgi:sugar fermentation stimulation protein A
VARPHRFAIDAELESGGLRVHAHLADPGRLKELLTPGARLWLAHNEDPKRKTRYSALLVESEGRLVSLDTQLPNRLVEAALKSKALPELGGSSFERREIKIGSSRFDFALSDAQGVREYLEVKSVTLASAGVARFPDAISSRGARHLRELAELAAADVATHLLFIIQRTGCEAMEIAREIDPAFGAAFDAARKAGMQAYARDCELSVEGIWLGQPIPIRD